MHNPICELLNIKYPILQGGMHGLSDAHLAAAVSNAGALGTLSPYARMSPGGDPVENLHVQIDLLRRLTQKPFAVNILLDLPLSGLLVDAAVELQVPVVVTAAGSAETYTELLHSAGIRVLHVIGTAVHAKAAEADAVDAVIAEGFEAAGRIGREETPLETLMPEVAGAVSLPVVAAGGIVDGKGMASAFALGASGAQMGTRFVAVKECPAHPAYKEAIVVSGNNATVVTRRNGRPVRSLRNGFVENLAAMERSGRPADEIKVYIGEGRARAAQVDGDMHNGDAYAGASVGHIHEILPAAAVIKNIIHEFNKTVESRQSRSHVQGLTSKV